VIHSICGDAERQSLFPLPLRSREDVSPEFLRGAGKPMKALGKIRVLPTVPRILAAQETTGHAIVEVAEGVWMMRAWLPAGAVKHADVVTMGRLLGARSVDEVLEIWRSPACAITVQEDGCEKFDFDKLSNLFDDHVLLNCRGKYAERPKCACKAAYDITFCPHCGALMEHLTIMRFTLDELPVGNSGRAGRPRAGFVKSHCLQTQQQADEANDRVACSRAGRRGQHDIQSRAPQPTSSLALPSDALQKLRVERANGAALCWWLGPFGEATVTEFLRAGCTPIGDAVRPTRLGHKELVARMSCGRLELKAWCILLDRNFTVRCACPRLHSGGG
jgi:hypothetical protein